MEISFAGYQITDVFRVRDVKRSILPPRVNYSTDVPSRHGRYFTGYKYEPRIIEVEIVMISNDLNGNMRSLAWMLDLPNPSKLIISDTPNVYHYAILDGDTNFNTIFKVGFGTLRFICFDPFGYSTLEKTFVSDINNKTVVNNGGTAPTAPKFEIDFTADCGQLTLLSPNGIIKIGQQNEVDVVAPPSSQVLINNNMSTTTGWIVNTSGKTRTLNTTIQGTVSSNGENIRASSYGTDIANKWFGTTIRRDIGATTADYWEASMTFKFMSDGWFTNSTDIKQIGRIEFNIMDENNNFLASFVMRDSYQTYEWTVPELWVGANTLVWFDESKTTSSSPVTQYNDVTKKYETKTVNPSFLGVWNNFFGKIIIRKTGNQFQFELQKIDQSTGAILSRVTKVYYDTTGVYTNVKAKSVMCWFGKYGTYPPVGLNYIDHVYFRKDIVNDYHNVPDIFHSGDKLIIDCNKSQVYLNNSLFMEKLDIGSRFFELVEGITEIQMLHSSKGASPTMTTKIIEKYL